MSGRLEVVEEIRQLKARYFRLLDTRQWDAWGDVFTADAELRFGPGADEVLVGREAIVGGVSSMLAGAVTVHHGHMPEIEVLGPDEASGVWAMTDDVAWPQLRLRGAGHYRETYERGDDGVWRIRTLELTRLRRDLRPEPDPAEVRAAVADLVARYNQSADAGRFDETAELFTDDAVLVLPQGEHVGRAAIAALFADTAERLRSAAPAEAPEDATDRSAVRTGPRAAVRHLSATLQVDVVDARRATGRAYYVVFLAGGPDHWGRYVDEYRADEGVWRIARRRVTVDGEVDGAWASGNR